MSVSVPFSARSQVPSSCHLSSRGASPGGRLALGFPVAECSIRPWTTLAASGVVLVAFGTCLPSFLPACAWPFVLHPWAPSGPASPVCDRDVTVRELGRVHGPWRTGAATCIHLVIPLQLQLQAWLPSFVVAGVSFVGRWCAFVSAQRRSVHFLLSCRTARLSRLPGPFGSLAASSCSVLLVHLRSSSSFCGVCGLSLMWQWRRRLSCE